MGCDTKSKNKSKATLLKYLRNNKARINYGQFISQGLMIGSGPIESAHREIIQKRLKLSGQRWTMKGAQQVINLRSYKYSNKWSVVKDLLMNNRNAA